MMKTEMKSTAVVVLPLLGVDRLDLGMKNFSLLKMRLIHRTLFPEKMKQMLGNK